MKKIEDITRIAFAAFLTIALTACSGSSKQGADEPAETALSGTISVLVDPAIIDVLSGAKALYDKEHPDAKVTLVPTDVHVMMERMLNHEERIAIVARDYTPSEDSARADDPGDTLQRTLLARDAVVFFADKSFPYDTMNAEHLRMWLRGDRGVRASYPKLAKDPTFIVSGGSTGSLYGNIVNVVLGRREPARSMLASVGTFDSVVAAVKKMPQSIGVGYLSQVGRDTSVKPLRLSYTNADGTHEWPKPVHVSYLIMGKYPFPVPIYVYLRDRPNQYNLPSGFMQFMTRNGNAQKSILTAGIEPGYGKFNLIMPE
jgi:ABC-type phosphate transport system substrate-binding protein